MPRPLPLILATLCLLIPLLVQAASPAKGGAKGKGGDAPISVEADHMTSFEKSNSVLFTGAVDARQDDVRIRTDKMTVYYTPEAKGGNKEGKKDGKTTAAPGGGQKKVEKMHCIGHVEVSRNDWLGTSNEMIYLAKERKVRLIGNAKAFQDQNTVIGEEIIHYIDEERSEVIAGPKGKTTTTLPGEGKGGDKPGRVRMTLPQ